ncbi:MAG: GNAT family N-acetyltransferase [bacterium]
MKKISLEELDQLSETYNNSVAAFSGIDPICSRTEWIIPFQHAFMPHNRVYIWQENKSFVGLTESKSTYGNVFFTSLEPMWGFPSPLIGPEAVDMLGALLSNTDESENLRSYHLILCGLPRNPGFLQQLVKNTTMNHQAFSLEPTRRCVASLAGGVDGFLKRRSSNFQSNLRRALRRIQCHGITFQRINQFRSESLSDMYDKIVDIERRSWKGLSGKGADQPPMKMFYYYMLKRIIPAGFLRLIFAVRKGKNIGYIYGIYINKRFRGLQFSFDNHYASLSLGNILQYRMIEWLCEESCIEYDLGSLAPYKRKWAEMIFITRTLYLKPLLC